MKLFLSTESRDPVSAVIRWNTRCPWSHTGFLREEDGWTFSAMIAGGVAWRPPNPRASGVMLDAPRIDEAFRWALTQAGKPYDWRAITGLAINRNWREDDSWFCSELVAAAFEQAHCPLLNKQAPVWRITPRDLLLSLAIKPLRYFRFSSYANGRVA